MCKYKRTCPRKEKLRTENIYNLYKFIKEKARQQDEGRPNKKGLQNIDSMYK